MTALSAWGLDTDDAPTRRRTPAQRAARARRRKAGRLRARILRQHGLESVHAIVMRCAHGAVRRAYLREDEPTDGEIGYWFALALRTRFVGAFPGTVGAMRAALHAVSGGQDCTTAAQRIHDMAGSVWSLLEVDRLALEEHDRIALLVACLPCSPLTGVLVDNESIFGALASAGLLERDGGAWRTTEAGRDAIVRYVGR